MKWAKEKLMKLGDTFLFASLISSLIALCSYFLNFSNNDNGLIFAFSNEKGIFALIPFIFLIISLIFSGLIFLIKYFPWGKIILVALSVILFASFILLFFIPNFSYGVIIALIFTFISASFNLIAAILK